MWKFIVVILAKKRGNKTAKNANAKKKNKTKNQTKQQWYSITIYTMRQANCWTRWDFVKPPSNNHSALVCQNKCLQCHQDSKMHIIIIGPVC